MCICSSGHHILLVGEEEMRCPSWEKGVTKSTVLCLLLVARDDGPGPRLGECACSRLSFPVCQERVCCAWWVFRPVWLLKKYVFWYLLFRRQKWFLTKQFLRSCILYKSEFYFLFCLKSTCTGELDFLSKLRGKIAILKKRRVTS